MPKRKGFGRDDGRPASAPKFRSTERLLSVLSATWPGGASASIASRRALSIASSLELRWRASASSRRLSASLDGRRAFGFFLGLRASAGAPAALMLVMFKVRYEVSMRSSLSQY